MSGIMGVTSLVTKLLLPDMVKESATYRVTFGMLQQFLIEQVAEVKTGEREFELKDKYVMRKTAGSILEGIGLVGIRFSPVWLLAILNDVAGGSKVYLQQLVIDMKRQGIVDEDAKYDTAYELLDGIQSSSALGVDAIDQPPVTLEEFGEFKEQLMDQYGKNNDVSRKLLRELEEIYLKMVKASEVKKVSLGELNGAMTMDLMRHAAKKGANLTKLTAGAGARIVNENIIKSYTASLERLNRVGKRKYLIEHMTPFMKQLRRHFDSDRETLTERIIDFVAEKLPKKN